MEMTNTSARMVDGVIEVQVEGITIRADLTGMNADRTRFKGYAIDDLRKVFDQVCDPDDWRAPIAVWMPGGVVMAVVAAIEFMTATHPRVDLDVNRMRYLVTSEGYRNGPAGP